MPRKRKAYSILDKPFERRLRPRDQPYQYDLLLPGEIRVLVLHAGSGDDPLSANLETVRLDENPRYEAISYVWGIADYVHDLRLSGGMLKITTSLKGALQRFRDPKKPVRLWADAVCINQHPNGDHGFVEKNHQVAMMGDIYSHAEKVLIWLGEADERDTMFFWLLQALVLENRRHDDWGSGTFIRNGGVESMPFPPGDTLEQACSCCETRFQLLESSWHEALCSVVAFWAKPWFHRLWVVQEKSLARQSTIFCGSHSLEMDGVKHAWACLYSYFSHHRDSSARNRQLLRAIELSITLSQEHINFEGLGDFINVLVELRRLQSHLPHDRLFAMKGICPFLNRFLPSPDYSVSEHKLWQTFTAAIFVDHANWHSKRPVIDMVENPNAGFLLVMAGLLRHDPISSLPSWVPDFGRIPQVADRLHAKHRYYGSFTYDSLAGGLTYNGSAPCFVEGGGMSFKGVVLGHIEAISLGSALPSVEILFRKDSGAWTLDDLLPWIKYCWNFVTSSKATLSDITSREILELLIPSRHDLKDKYLDALEDLLCAHCSVDSAIYVGDEIASATECIAGAVQNVKTQHVEWHFGLHTQNAGSLLAKSSGGQFCWVPPHAMVGDKVCLLNGADMPFIIRPNGEGRYRLVGDAYVHGVMYGEAWPREIPDKEIYKDGESVKRPIQKLPPEDMKPIQDIVLI